MLQTPHRPLQPRHLFIKRVTSNALIAIYTLLFSLSLGMLGYHYYEKMNLIDSFVNAAMILSGMGPVSELKTDGGKIFAACYALFSGIIFIFVIAVVLAPVLHRLFHKFHIEDNNQK